MTPQNEKLHIAFIRRKYCPGRGGAELVAHKFVEGFIKRGHRISVFSEKFQAKESDSLRWIKVPRRRICSVSSTSGFHRTVQQMLRNDDLRRSFDLVYSLCRTYPVDVFRVTEQFHDEWLNVGYSPFARLNPRHRAIMNLEKKTLRAENVGHVIANSEFIRSRLINNFNYPQSRISVIHNGIDRQTFFPAQTDEKASCRKKLRLEDKFICLFVAGNFRIKGLESAILTLTRLPEEVELLVVGGDRSAPFLKMAEKCGVLDRVIFAGAQRKLRDYYIASDLLLYPSLYDTFGNVCLEAMACGLPVVTTRMIGASDIVKDNINGFLVDDASYIDSMSDFIRQYMLLPEKEKLKFSRAAVAATTNYSWEQHLDALETLFLKLHEGKQT